MVTAQPAPVTEVRRTVDIVAIAGSGPERDMLLVRRQAPPFEGLLALPGGVVQAGESAFDAAVRVFGDATGIVIGRNQVRDVGQFDAVGRDPRGPSITTAYHVRFPSRVTITASSSEAAWHRVLDVMCEPLAFDHADISNHAEFAWARPSAR